MIKRKLKLKHMLLGMIALKAMPVLGSGPNIHGLLETVGVQDQITEYSTFDDLCALAQTNKKLHKNVNSRWLWPFNFKTKAEFQESFNKMSLRFLPLSLTFHLPNRTPEILNMIPDTTKFSKRPYEKVLAAVHRKDYSYIKNWSDADLDCFGRFAMVFNKSFILTSRIDALRELKDMKFDEKFKNKRISDLAIDFVFEPKMDRDDPLEIALSFDLATPDLMKLWEKLKTKSVNHHLLPKFLSQKLEEPLKKEVREFYKKMIDNTNGSLSDRLNAMKLISNLIIAEESAEYFKIFESIISSTQEIDVKISIVEALSFLHLDAKTQDRLAHLVLSFDLMSGLESKALEAMRKFKFLNPYIKAEAAELSLTVAQNPEIEFCDKLDFLELFTGFTNGERKSEVIRVLNDERSIDNQHFVLREILKFIPYDASIKQRYEEIVGHPDVVIWEKYSALAELLKAEKDMVFLDQALSMVDSDANPEGFNQFLRGLETLPKETLVDVYLKILETKNMGSCSSKTILNSLFKINVDQKNEALMIKVALKNIEDSGSNVYTKLDFLEFLVKFDLNEKLRAELTAVCDQMPISEYQQSRMNNIRANLIP